VDIQNIATHEVGHLLGIDHSSESLFESEESLVEATMYFASETGETSRRDLSSDDILAVQSLYSASIPNAPTLSSGTEIERLQNEVTFSIKGSAFGAGTSFVLTQNKNSIYDAVSRYKTIESSSEATVVFDVGYFPSGSATLMAFNHASEIATIDVELSESSLAANSSSSGGGGGCQLQSKNSSWSFLSFLMVLIFFLGTQRFRRLSLPSSQRSR